MYKKSAFVKEINPCSTLEQYASCTFDNFNAKGRDNNYIKNYAITRRVLGEAKEACIDMAKYGEGWILITGASCTGKSHLAAAAIDLRRNIGLESSFIGIPRLLEFLRTSKDQNGYGKGYELIRELSHHRFLVLDELFGDNHEEILPWAQDSIDQLLVLRYNLKLPTLVTSIKEIEDFPQRLKCRFLDKSLCKLFSFKHILPYCVDDYYFI